MFGSPESLRIASWREEEAKEKANEDSKDKEEHSLVKNKHVILNGSLQKMVLGGPKEDEAKRVDRKVKIASLQVVVALADQKRVQVVRASVKEHIALFF